MKPVLSYGTKAVENKFHIHDLHASILHLLGLDHEKLTYRYAGPQSLLRFRVESVPFDSPRRPCVVATTGPRSGHE